VGVAATALLLSSCPSQRNGVPGQLGTAKDDTVSAARSAALALDLWAAHRSTEALTCVQIADARDQIVKAYEDIATLKVEEPPDLARQALLIRAMSDLTAALGTASAAVRALPGQPDPRVLKQQLVGGADALERDYRG
jgi:hypothetical protein